MSFRIGTKVGKKTFVSFGKSGTYISTWIGGYRLSKFTPSKKTKKTAQTKDERYDNLDLSGCHLGACMGAAIIAAISYFPAVWLFSSIIAGIISVFAVYWIGWAWVSRKYYKLGEASIGDIATQFFIPFFSFLTLGGLIAWGVMFTIGFGILVWM